MKNRIWICTYITRYGTEKTVYFHDMEKGLKFVRKLDERINRGTCGGYIFSEL